MLYFLMNLCLFSVINSFNQSRILGSKILHMPQIIIHYQSRQIINIPSFIWGFWVVLLSEPYFHFTSTIQRVGPFSLKQSCPSFRGTPNYRNTPDLPKYPKKLPKYPLKLPKYPSGFLQKVVICSHTKFYRHWLRFEKVIAEKPIIFGSGNSSYSP
jgi:hypothetical protein